MRAMVLRGTDLAIEEVALPPLKPGQVLARVLACGICGSDLHMAKYGVDLQAQASAQGVESAMDLQAGVVMGHEFCAEVVQAAEGSEPWKPGDRVTCVPVLINPERPLGVETVGYSSTYPGGYGEYLILSAPMLLKVPDGLPARAAATTEPCAVGMHAVRQANVTPSDSILVMGAGPIGLMTLLWLKKDGAKHVTVSDPAAPRRELARKAGADLVLDPTTDDILARVTEASGEPNLIFECVGIEGTLQNAVDMVQRHGRIIVVGVCMTPDTIRPLACINKHVTMQFVLGYTPEEYAEALQAIAEGLDTLQLVTRVVDLDTLPSAFLALSDPTECKVVFEP